MDLPRDDLFRAITPGVELRRNGADRADGMPTMVGHFTVFYEWAEIDSIYEGHFLERTARGAFTKTIAESKGRMRVLFQHGQDPQVGNKVLGPIAVLEEDETGPRYEVELLDTSYNRDLLPGLEAGLYGASYRFKIMREDKDMRPPRSAHNPDGLPERTITEAKVREFGPCTWPAFAGASAGIRSLTDEFLIGRLAEDPERLERLAARAGLSLNGHDQVVDRVQRGDREYKRAIEYVADNVWTMYAPALATVVQILAERRSGNKPTPAEIRERIGVREEPPPVSESPVAVIRLFGAIIPHADSFSEMSGATSLETFSDSFRDALASEDVKAILLDINSPGGSAQLVDETAAMIRAARGTKPIVAFANTRAASAAYYLAAQADEVVVTPSGDVGSVGAYSSHQDLSAMMEELGIDTTLVSAGKYKVEGNPFEPLSEEAEAEMQRRVDAVYDQFVRAVAKGRGVSTKDVADNFGQGRMVLAADAVTAGMADRVATFADTLARLEKQTAADRPPATGRAAAPPAHEPEPSEATTHQAGSRRTRDYLTEPKEVPAWRL